MFYGCRVCQSYFKDYSREQKTLHSILLLNILVHFVTFYTNMSMFWFLFHLQYLGWKAGSSEGCVQSCQQSPVQAGGSVSSWWCCCVGASHQTHH